jgi:hypothetical protein
MLFDNIMIKSSRLQAPPAPIRSLSFKSQDVTLQCPPTTILLDWKTIFTLLMLVRTRKGIDYSFALQAWLLCNHEIVLILKIRGEKQVETQRSDATVLGIP